MGYIKRATREDTFHSNWCDSKRLYTDFNIWLRMGKQPNDLRMRQVTFKSVSASLLIHSVIFFVVVVRYLEIGTNTQYNLAV